MSIELRIPDVGESVREVQIGRWLKREGDTVKQDENLVELETDKASMELPAPSGGVLIKVLKAEGELVGVGDVIGYIEARSPQNAAHEPPDGSPKASDTGADTETEPDAHQRPETSPSDGKNADAAMGGSAASQSTRRVESEPARSRGEIAVTPAARRALRDHGLSASELAVRGPRISRDDVLRYVQDQERDETSQTLEGALSQRARGSDLRTEELEEVVPMSLIRRRIAERLVHAQQEAALLTTFNEIDMTKVKELRATYRDSFQKKHGIKLGFMSFFVKAVVDALRDQPGLNAEIRDEKIIYRHYYHIGVAIGSEKGLVVPVIPFAERLSFAEIEQTIEDLASRAARNKLNPQELAGGTFTISNGGIYGSLLSTPIVNPPQSGILGMHAIQDRPVAVNGQVVIRPMMYIALTYDHRIVDGKEAVTFLKQIKEAIEDPARLLLDV